MAASAYHVISKEIKNRCFRQTRIFKHIYMYKQPILTKCCGIITILSKYYIVISDKLIDTWLCFPVARWNIIKASWESKKKKLSYRKKYIEEFVWQTSLFWLHSLIPMSFFLLFFSSNPSLSSTPILGRKKVYSRKCGVYSPFSDLVWPIQGIKNLPVFFSIVFVQYFLLLARAMGNLCKSCLPVDILIP